jgi:hypothetical protein
MNQDDMFRSVYRLLWQLYAAERAAGLRIEDKRSQKLTRPHMRLEQTAEKGRDFGDGLQRKDCQYAITYYGTSRQDCTAVVAKLYSYLKEGGREFDTLDLIPGWRFGWNFPQPYVELRAGGTIPTGDHIVRISGIDVCGNESAASFALHGVTDGAQLIHIRIPRVTWNHPLFPSYNVFVDGHLEASVDMPQWGYPSVDIESLVGTGRVPLEAILPSGELRSVRWRHMRVTDYSSVQREDLLENGLFQSTITLGTTFMGTREPLQTGVMENVEFVQTLEVAY